MKLTPKEKALMLMSKLYDSSEYMARREAIKGAIVCCDEIISTLQAIGTISVITEQISYYEEVKHELYGML
jgi:hypothetical protein